MQPQRDYVYAQEIKKTSGIVMTSDISDTRQHYKVLKVGPGYVSPLGNYVEADQKLVGKTVIIQKHAAEGDTPPDMLGNGYALFPAERIMAVIDG